MKQDVANGLEMQEMSDAEFDIITKLAANVAGLEIPDGKRALVSSRLSRRMRKLQIPDYKSYIETVQSATDPEELREFISALTTNVTSFYREKHHFDFLGETIAPILAAKHKRNERIRVWSAGCSKGHEPYTIAMTLLKACPQLADADFRVLATDIDRKVLSTARQGRYSAEDLLDLTADERSRYFSKDAEGGFTANDTLKRTVQFRELNLHGDWPMTGQFDVIFCRNVTIYFNAEMSGRLWKRFHDILVPDGWLFLGHSERLPESKSIGFSPAGITTYRKN